MTITPPSCAAGGGTYLSALLRRPLAEPPREVSSYCLHAGLWLHAQISQ